METKVAGLIGRPTRSDRGPHGPPQWLSAAHLGHPRADHRAGDSESTAGTYFPWLLQPRRRAGHALLAVVQEAYVHGVSARKVDELMKALGLDRVSKSEVSRICGGLDPLVEAFRTRAPATEYPYIWERHVPQSPGERARHQPATVMAVGVTSDGERQVLGIDVGRSEDRAFWTAFLRSLVQHGLRGGR